MKKIVFMCLVCMPFVFFAMEERDLKALRVSVGALKIVTDSKELEGDSKQSPQKDRKLSIAEQTLSRLDNSDEDFELSAQAIPELIRRRSVPELPIGNRLQRSGSFTLKKPASVSPDKKRMPTPYTQVKMSGDTLVLSLKAIPTDESSNEGDQTE